MPKARIMIVEDESIVALSIQKKLKKLGYEGLLIVSTGEDAVLQAEKTRPDLVLMDMMLKGDMDGVAAAGKIEVLFNIPVVYLTAYSDEPTLHRAKITEPFGYLVKPFEERDLYATIEMSLYKNQMEKKLKASEQWLATTLKSIGDAVITTDNQGHIQFMNPIAENLTGGSQTEIGGKVLTDVFNMTHEETRTLTENPVNKVLQEGLVVGLGNHTLLIARDGTKRSIEGSAAPIRDENGNILGVVLVFHDVTERRQTEVALKEYLERLEEMVATRTKELQVAQDTLISQEKLVILGQLAGGVAHELRNPLGVISNAIYFLQMILTDPDETVKEYLGIIANRVYEAEKIISDLLNFSRNRVGEKENIEISKLVAEVLQKQSLPEQIVVTIRISSDLPPVFVDAQQVNQVLTNLISNACQAMPAGGELTISAQAGQGEISLSIADTGQGISPENLEKIFEPLFTTKPKGIGLGLVVSKNLIKVNEGQIEVKSEVGQGSTFTITLPTKEAIL